MMVVMLEAVDNGSSVIHGSCGGSGGDDNIDG